MRFDNIHKLTRAAVMVTMAVMLTGCFLSPGKFQSELDLRRDGSFAFSYNGEIVFVGLSQLARMEAESRTFTPTECYDEENDFAERECTADELAEQKQNWEEQRKARADRDQEQAEQMAALFGGIDLSDPEAGDKLAKQLERQRGWNKVTHRGEGIFDVNFAVEGKLDHDFLFPLMEKFAAPTYFVQVILRDDNKVRVEAPAFAGKENPFGMGMMGGAAGLASMGSARDDNPFKNLVPIDGTFSITTDGAVLANNTDEGPAQVTNGQLLTWSINTNAQAAPTALIDLN